MTIFTKTKIRGIRKIDSREEKTLEIIIDVR